MFISVFAAAGHISFPSEAKGFTAMRMLEAIGNWARRIKRDAFMLWFARRHPDTPFLAKALCVFTVAYALSPIDLIPDFIPVLGYVDDALLLPAFIWLAIRLLPSNVILECRAQAEEWMAKQKARPASYAGALAIMAIWISVLYLCWWWYYRSG
jgi:uncharacterized membrane protein YkvA (DUF1232 family)